MTQVDEELNEGFAMVALVLSGGGYQLEGWIGKV